MKKSIIYLILFFTMISQLSLEAQRFSASAIVGINASQIDGDGIYGYDKLGMTGGARLAYSIKDNGRANAAIEFLYSQRGSSPDITFGDGSFNTIDLKYIEIPLLVEYNDWLQEEGYYKVGIEGGVSYGNLFEVNTSNQIVNNDLAGYKKHDLSYTLGLRYSVNSRISGSFRYSRSLLRIHRNEDAGLDGLISHWLSFRLQVSI